MNEVTIDGMVLSANVIETIVAVAAEEVPGVEAIGQVGAAAGLLSVLQQKPLSSGVEFELDEQGQLCLAIHIDVKYGTVLPEVAANVREAVAQAMVTQLGVTVGKVDVFVDGVRFE